MRAWYNSLEKEAQIYTGFIDKCSFSGNFFSRIIFWFFSGFALKCFKGILLKEFCHWKFFFDMLFLLKSYEKKSFTVYKNNFSIEKLFHFKYPYLPTPVSCSMFVYISFVLYDHMWTWSFHINASIYGLKERKIVNTYAARENAIRIFKVEKFLSYIVKYLFQTF